MNALTLCWLTSITTHEHGVYTDAWITCQNRRSFSPLGNTVSRNKNIFFQNKRHYLNCFTNFEHRPWCSLFDSGISLKCLSRFASGAPSSCPASGLASGSLSPARRWRRHGSGTTSSLPPSACRPNAIFASGTRNTNNCDQLTKQ